MSTRCYGSGDELIVVEGDLAAEFYADEEVHYLAFSDGTLITFNFIDGYWKPEVVSDNDWFLTEASKVDDIASDVVEIDHSPEWVVFGKHYEHQ